MTIRPELRKAVNAVKEAKKETERIQKIVLPIQQRVLSDLGMPLDEDQLSEEQFEEYAEELDAAYREAGFDLPEPGDCPLMRAQNQERKAQNKMIDEASYITGLKAEDLSHRLDLYNQIVIQLMKLP